jgi:tRNA (guanosine-2'-O-)-methyltransferase
VLESRYSYEESVRIARGSGKWTDVIRHHDISSAVGDLRSRGYRIVAATPGEAAVSLRELPIDQPFAIIFGAEKRGLSAEAEGLADYSMHIPMQGFTESLNVSVAAALSLYELSWRVRNSHYPWQLSESEKYDLLVEWAMKSVRSADDLMRVYKEQHGK